MATGFFIVLGVIALLQVLGYFSLYQFVPVVKAGNVDKLCLKYKMIFNKKPSALLVDQKEVNVSRMTMLYVKGNSMKNYDILNGQEVFVETYTSDQKYNIKNFPVVVLEILNSKDGSKYKLRKFVGYLSSPNPESVSDIYTRYKDRIKISEEDFENQMRKKISKISDKPSEYVLSETYNDFTREYCYSLHPVDSIYGEVKYVA